MSKKYYVQSGTLREVLMANDEFDACEKAIYRRFKQDKLPVDFGIVIMVSDKSFMEYLTPVDHPTMFNSIEILSQIGFLELADKLRERFPPQLIELVDMALEQYGKRA